MKEVDYNSNNEKLIISMLKKYINSVYGEIYSTLKSEMPLVYAATRDTNSVKTYELIKRI